MHKKHAWDACCESMLKNHAKKHAYSAKGNLFFFGRLGARREWNGVKKSEKRLVLSPRRASGGMERKSASEKKVARAFHPEKWGMNERME